MRVRGDRLPAHPRQAADARGTERLQGASSSRCAVCPPCCAARWRLLPAGTHPMDVLRTGASVLGCALPEKDDHAAPGARDIADRLIASFGSMLRYWYHFSHSGQRIQVETEDDSVGGHFLHLLHRRAPPASWVRAMHTSLILYAEHEFNASTFAARVIAGTGRRHLLLHHRRNRRAARTQARRRQRGGLRDPAALRDPGRGRSRHPRARRQQGSHHRLRPSGLHASPIRATRSSRRSRASCPRRPAT